MFLTLLFCGNALAAELIPVNAGGVAALADASGAEILAAGRFESVFAVREGELYAAGSEDAWELYDANGNYVAGPFGMIADMGGALVFRRGGRYGAMSASGELLLEPVWTQLSADGPERFLALNTSPLDEQPDEVWALSASGEARATGVRADGGLSAFHEGRMPFRASDGRYGCLDGAGAAVIAPEWAWIGDFSNGAAIVSDGAGYGLIDRDGAIRVSPRYVWLQRGEDMLLALREDGALELLSADGSEILCEIPDAPEAQPAGRYAAVRRANGTTLYDRAGAAVYAASAQALIFPGLDGQFIVRDGAWGGDCEWLAGPGGVASGKHQRILPLTAGRYAVLRFGDGFSNVRYGLMDEKGAGLLPDTYLEILPAGRERLILVTEEEVILSDPDGAALRAWPRG